ncbi:hypothetical protein WBP06_27505 [Novosphingobium sp. BL-8H]|uniref:hypothetical protein n=1 Tax=Novosphingobium sp. BL-8H TaxID=3127640 RepID=UPI0037570DBE
MLNFFNPTSLLFGGKFHPGELEVWSVMSIGLGFGSRLSPGKFQRSSRAFLIAILSTSLHTPSVAQAVSQQALSNQTVSNQAVPVPPPVLLPAPPQATLPPQASVSTPAKPPSEEASFQRCDGYYAPNGKVDHFVRESTFFGLASQKQDLRQSRDIAPGATGVAACETALASPLLKPEFAYRRLNLMQAQAVHLIGAGDPARALAVLEQASRFTVEIPATLRAKGFDLANKAIRTYALIKSGKLDGVETSITEIAAQRPYSPSVQELADLLRVELASARGSAPTAESMLELRWREVPQSPQYIAPMLLSAFQLSRFADVAKLGAGFSISQPISQGRWEYQGAVFDKDARLDLRILVAGMTAYSEAALGKTAAVNDINARTLASIDAEANIPPPDEKGVLLGLIRPSKSEREQDLKRYQGYLKHLERARLDLAAWNRLIELREKAATLPAAALRAEVMSFGPKGILVLADMLSQSPDLATPEGRKQIDLLQKLTQAQRQNLEKYSLTRFLNSLPRAEMPETQPHFMDAKSGGILRPLVPLSGGTAEKMDAENHWTVHYSAPLASSATTEELALLNAALLAKSQGYDRIIIESRFVVLRTLNLRITGPYYTSSAISNNAGRDAIMTVWLVNSNEALPKELSGSEWREIEVDPIITDLSSEYHDLISQTA